MGDTRKLFDVVRPGVATLRVIDGHHTSLSAPVEFRQAVAGGDSSFHGHACVSFRMTAIVSINRAPVLTL